MCKKVKTTDPPFSSPSPSPTFWLPWSLPAISGWRTTTETELQNSASQLQITCVSTKLHINCTLKLHNIAATQPVWPDGKRCECRSCWRGSSLCLQLIETWWTLLQDSEYSISKVSLNIVNLLEGTWYWSQSFRLRLPSLSVQTSSYPLWGGKNSQNIRQAEIAYHKLNHYSCFDWPSNLAKKTASPRYM